MIPPRRVPASAKPGSEPRASQRRRPDGGLSRPIDASPGIVPVAPSPAVLPWLQRQAGNAAVAKLLAPPPGSAAIQRHARGARPSMDVPRAAAELRATGPAGAAATATPAAPAAAPPAPVLAASPGPAPAVGPGGGGAAAGPAPGPGAPPPRALRNEAMTLATADSALTAAYGRVRRIVRVPVTILDHAGILRAYDDDCIARGVLYTDPRTGATRPWRRGDADPDIEGFALTDSSRIYVQSDTTLPTATAHELLHANTAADFRGAVGEAINEGATEHLAIKAVAAAGLPTVGPTGALAYPDQVTAVQQLIRVVGEDTLIAAYFGGSASLVAAYEALMPHTFATLRGTGTLDTAHMAALLVPRTAAQKIDLVRARLAAVPTEADAAAIRAICNSDAAMIPAIRAGVFADISRVVSERLDAPAAPANREVIQRVRSLPCADNAAISGILFFRVLPRITSTATAASLAEVTDFCGRDPAGVSTVRATVGPAITSLANERLNGWVSDADIDFIERLYRLPVADQASMRAVLGPRATDLWSFGQRMRLRVILASGRP